jgi:hypothetical protein
MFWLVAVPNSARSGQLPLSLAKATTGQARRHRAAGVPAGGLWAGNRRARRSEYGVLRIGAG